MLDAVTEFINNNIVNSSAYDSATELQKRKAVNQAERQLLRLFPDKYVDGNIPVEHLAEQSIFLLKIDDLIQRSDLGVTFIMVDGISMNISKIDRTVCPYIMQVFNLSENWNARRKVGRYSTYLQDSHRRIY